MCHLSDIASWTLSDKGHFNGSGRHCSLIIRSKGDFLFYDEGGPAYVLKGRGSFHLISPEKKPLKTNRLDCKLRSQSGCSQARMEMESIGLTPGQRTIQREPVKVAESEGKSTFPLHQHVQNQYDKQ